MPLPPYATAILTVIPISPAFAAELIAGIVQRIEIVNARDVAHDIQFAESVLGWLDHAIHIFSSCYIGLDRKDISHGLPHSDVLIASYDRGNPSALLSK